MTVIKLTKPDWLASMDRLSVGAFYLLNVLYRIDIDASDTTMMYHTGTGVSSHRRHKKELIDQGYLDVEQVGRGEYTYTLKDSNVNRTSN